MILKMNNKNKQQKGFLLVSSIIILSGMMLIMNFYLNGIIQNVKFSQILNASPQTYYLAESGVQEAMWKIQNDPLWKNNFETDPNWKGTLTRNNALVPGGSWSVTVENQGLAQALITATSTIAVSGTQTQRVVKASVYKAFNADPLISVAAFAEKNLTGLGSVVNLSGGDFFTNKDIDLKLFSSWTTDKKARAVNKINVAFFSELNADEGKYDKTNPPIPEQILMPAIDFDSSDPNSYKSRADYVFTSDQFKKLMDDYPVLELEGIIYVTGNVFIKKGSTVIINGVLLTDNSLSIGNGFSVEWEPAVLIINNTGTGNPSGVLSKKNITIGGFNSDVVINGLAYAGSNFTIKDGITQNVTVNIDGAVIANEIDVQISWQPVVITLNQNYVSQALGTPLFSQILFINHWEEKY
jgi:hypothetical protein